MLSSVSRLIPRSGSFEYALAAFRAAALQDCLAQLHGVESDAARLLRARVSLRLGRPKFALETLEGIEADRARDRAEMTLLRAVATSRLGDDERADYLFRDAYVFSISASDRALEAEIQYYRGVSAFGQSDLDLARQECESGLDIAAAPRRFFESSGIVPLKHIVARTQELLGIVDMAQGNYRHAIVHARAVLATLDSCDVPDVFQQAYALRNISMLARDFDLEDEALLLSKRVPMLKWTQDISLVHFTTAEALAWCSALRGDCVEALRLFRRAENAATVTPERIIIGVDRSLLAREAGHRAMFIEEVENALRSADEYDWEKAAGDYREALLSLAQAAASIAPARARVALDRYAAIVTSMDRLFASRMEPRARAEEAYTQGLVFRAEGRATLSRERLQTAFETWDRIGYEWRAGRAALELAELDSGEVFRMAVRRELQRRPNSVFSTRARLVA